jgi:hypothetical protein
MVFILQQAVPVLPVVAEIAQATQIVVRIRVADQFFKKFLGSRTNLARWKPTMPPSTISADAMCGM